MLKLLNYTVQGHGQPIVLIHGLFGNLDNLGLLARDLCQDHQVISVDLRNHGKSFHSDEHNYDALAQDVIQVLNHLNLSACTVIGHSMGGKVAMNIAKHAPTLLHSLIILDMSPVAYTSHNHDAVFAGLTAVEQLKPTSRQDCLHILAQHIEMDGVIQFLSKSLYKPSQIMQWRFNVKALINSYADIVDWQTIPQSDCPTLFIKGADSDYIQAQHQQKIVQQFSNAKAHVINNAGHWLHAEKPTEVLRSIRKFLTKTPIL